MFKKIMVPVDLAHIDSLDKAMNVATDLAKLYGAVIHYVGVTGSGPGAAGHNPDEFNAHLKKLADERARQSGVDITAKTIVSNDVAVELDATLKRAGQDLDADLIVVGSHVPSFADYIFSAHGSSLATHASASVFVVR